MCQMLSAYRERRRNGLIHILKHLARAFEQRLTCDSQLDLMCRAFQQLAANDLLETPNLATQRGLRHVQPVRGSAEVQFLRHGHEGSQMTQLNAVGRLRERKQVSTLCHTPSIAQHGL